MIIVDFDEQPNCKQKINKQPFVKKSIHNVYF